MAAGFISSQPIGMHEAPLYTAVISFPFFLLFTSKFRTNLRKIRLECFKKVFVDTKDVKMVPKAAISGYLC